MNNPNAVAVRNNTTAIQINATLSTWAEMQEVGGDLAKSQMLGAITQPQGTMTLIACREEGLSLTGFKKKYQWIGNELSTRPNWMLGEFKRHGGKVHIEQADRDACEIHFTHWDGETLKCRISWDDVKDLDFTKDKYGNCKANWLNFRDDMLFARVCGKGLRRICPEIFCGMYTDGEAQDFESDIPAAPKEIKPTAVKAKIEKMKAAKPAPKAEAPATEVAPIAEPEQPQPEATAPTAEVIEPEVMPSAEELDLPTEAAALTCPVKGDWFGKTYAEIAAENPDIIQALLTCNRKKHPELTDEHLAALEKIAVAMQ